MVKPIDNATHASLLIELGTEDLPPKALDQLARAFADGICDGLRQRGIEAGCDAAKVYCSPRRLAVWVPGVARQQPDQSNERRGPALGSGLDADGQPTRALLGFAKSCGVAVAELDKLETDKGAWFVHHASNPGQATAALLPEIIEAAVRGLPIPKPMRWSDHDYSFVRPLHWLVIVHGEDVVDAEIMGVASGRDSRGHRFHHPQPVAVASADSWLDALRAARVLADPQVRRQRIREEVARVAKGAPQLDDALLDELANLAEWPVAVGCAFDAEFLALPPEVLVTTMVANQKFVPVHSDDDKLSEQFVGIANIESTDVEQIRKGYERVIRPRFADAKFFWDEDLKTPLADQQQTLRDVTYQRDLGSTWDKCLRVAEMARIIANRVGVDAALAAHAASLSKCDLMTRMVGEFPELQGVMGRYYAQAQGEDPDVARALDEFYMPRQSADAIASTPLARVLAVAERLDTLAGIFAVGLKPSGNRDPFALRRAALGLARTLIEGELDIDLRAHFIEALEQLPDTAFTAGNSAPDAAPVSRAELADTLYGFVVERLRGYYADQGFSGALFDAVAAVEPHSLLDFDRRLRALADFAARPESARLAAANKRVANILRKQAHADAPTDAAAPASELAEVALAEAFAAASHAATAHVADADYASALDSLAALDAPLDRFFTDVMVIDPDARERARKLALLARIHAQFLAIADIARLQELHA